MTLTRKFTAVGATALIAFAGAGVASAAEGDTSDGSLPTTGSAEIESSADVAGSVQGEEALGSFSDDGQFDVSKAAEALKSISGVAGNIGDLADAYGAIVGASDAFQGVVSDTQAFLDSLQ
jgi:hypothetical protein